MSRSFGLVLFELVSIIGVGLGETGSITYEKFHVDSIIVSRYARTSITSVLLNSANISQEVSFQVQLPETAFISNFTMEVNGTTYLGLADEKKRASAEFERRKDDGQNVGLVESRGSNVFVIRSNTAAGSHSTFVLTYEELITRTLSMYQQLITLNPGYVVTDLRISVRVIDSQGILRFNGSSFVTSKRVSDKEVQFMYSPTMAEQNDETSGLSRDVVIKFDVNHPTDKSAGLIIVNDCYFAQFFSPGDFPTIPVDIVFVMDISGSMYGTKIAQARQSLVEIISQLNDDDHFTIVTFSNSAKAWKSSLVSVAEFREEGKTFASGLNASGGTNFYDAILTSIAILNKTAHSNHVQLLVMLSDGEPTVGITNPDKIVATATRQVSDTRISLNMLGFGTNLNLLLLQRLAIANRGIVKQIFEGKDAAAQLEGFYRSISSPILHSLNFKYPTSQIETISDVKIPLLFQGSEVVVAGKFSDSTCVSGTSVPVSVSGTGATSEQSFTSQVDPTVQTVIAGIKPDTERLVAYLTIQQLLRSLKVANNSEQIRHRALNLALDYNFVTELTSLIVVEESVIRKVPRENITSYIATSSRRLKSDRPYASSASRSFNSYSYHKTLPSSSFYTSILAFSAKPGGALRKARLPPVVQQIPAPPLPPPPQRPPPSLPRLQPLPRVPEHSLPPWLRSTPQLPLPPTLPPFIPVHSPPRRLRPLPPPQLPLPPLPPWVKHVHSLPPWLPPWLRTQPPQLPLPPTPPPFIPVHSPPPWFRPQPPRLPQPPTPPPFIPVHSLPPPQLPLPPPPPWVKHVHSFPPWFRPQPPRLPLPPTPPPFIPVHSPPPWFRPLPPPRLRPLPPPSLSSPPTTISSINSTTTSPLPLSVYDIHRLFDVQSGGRHEHTGVGIAILVLYFFQLMMF